MNSLHPDRFVRVPTELLEALLQTPLTGIQWRVIIWIIRQTFGWNRLWTPFSWYRIAKELDCDRPAVFRAGRRLLQNRLVIHRRRQLSIQSDAVAGDHLGTGSKTVVAAQRWTTRERSTKEQQKPLSLDNESVVREQRFSVERKTGVKTTQKRRRSGGYEDNCPAAEKNPLRELMNFYGALNGGAVSSVEAGRFSHSAKALLDACSGNLQEAKALLAQSFAKPET